MKIPFVDLKAQYLSIKDEIDDAISSVINDTAFIKGRYVEEFEESFSEEYKTSHVVSCANGTDAIYIALKSLNIGHGDEVITTSLSWISTSETISQTGAKPIFVDIDKDLFTIDCDQIEKKINEKTKAIIPVHLYGQPVDMDKVMLLAKKYKLRVIEDCAQAHFAQWNNQNVGTIGDIGTFSFFPGKNLGAYGDAGCLITNDSSLAEKARKFANHGALVKHEHEIEGINSRLDGLQAAILSVKIKYIHKWTDLRIKHASNYSKIFESFDNILIPKVQNPAKHVFHLYVIKCKSRDQLKKYLNDNGIATGIHYPSPLPHLEAYNYLKMKESEYNRSLECTRSILSLPMYPELNNEKIDFICRTIEEFQKNRNDNF